jgi:hypothetical protein
VVFNGDPAIASLYMEEDSTFCAATETNSDFCNLNLQAIQALKGKRTPKQANPKCNCDSSSFADKKYSGSKKIGEKVVIFSRKLLSLHLRQVRQVFCIGNIFVSAVKIFWQLELPFATAVIAVLRLFPL